MYFLKRALAIALGIVAFALIARLIPPTLDLWSHAFFQSTNFPGGQPNDRFMVVVRDSNEPDREKAYLPVAWRRMPEVAASGRKFTFRMPAPGGEIPSEGDLYRYDVLEDRKSSQIIEVRFANSYTSWSRYEAYEDRVVPLSYRTDGSILALVPILAMLLFGGFAGLGLTKLLRRALGVSGDRRTAPP